MLSHQSSVIWAPPTSFVTTSEFRNTYISVFRIANPYYKRSPTFNTPPSVFTPSLLLRQFTKFHSTVYPLGMAGYEIVNTLPKSAKAISKLLRVHAFCITAWILDHRSFSILLTKLSVRFSSGWTVNCPDGICTHWMSTTSWHTNDTAKIRRLVVCLYH
jgi:hypothetical protein